MPNKFSILNDDDDEDIKVIEETNVSTSDINNTDNEWISKHNANHENKDKGKLLFDNSWTSNNKSKSNTTTLFDNCELICIIYRYLM